MIILGLTGSIGMGKTTAATMLRRLGCPVFDADAAVHRLMAPGGAAVRPILAVFPETIDGGGGIARAALGRAVFGEPARLRRLESILHPLVRAAERRFLAACTRRRVACAVLDIPLLFETGGEDRCDVVLVVTAPEFLQVQRVLRRPGMTRDRFAAIKAQQMPDRDKRRRTPYVVTTGLGKRFARRRLIDYLAEISEKNGKKSCRSR